MYYVLMCTAAYMGQQWWNIQSGIFKVLPLPTRIVKVCRLTS